MRSEGRSSAVLPLLAATLVFVITSMSDVILEYKHPASFWPFLIDDVVMSALSGFLVWFYERRRSRELARKLYVVAEMNHRVRNELEIIQYSAYSTKEKQHIATISESVARIETALRDILERRRSGPPPYHNSAAEKRP